MPPVKPTSIPTLDPACAFHLLALTALRDLLPDGVSPGQARSALTAVIHRTMKAPDTFDADADGWLRIGLCGHQPSLA